MTFVYDPVLVAMQNEKRWMSLPNALGCRESKLGKHEARIDTQWGDHLLNLQFQRGEARLQNETGTASF